MNYNDYFEEDGSPRVDFKSLYHMFIFQAYLVAEGSPDPSTQNGAIIVSFGEPGENGYNKMGYKILGSACNTFPPGVAGGPARLQRPLKYQVVEHAERGAIYDAARRGNCTEGAVMFVPWYACDNCARAIICSGIGRVVGHKGMMDKTPDHWKESIDVAFMMFREAGVQTEFIEGDVGGPELLFNGELWHP